MSAEKLQPQALMDAAKEMTGGLTDFGDDSFRPGLEKLCAALESEARLSETGRDTFRQKLTAQLANRLWLEDHIQRKPEILEEEVAPPLIIVGLPLNMDGSEGKPALETRALAERIAAHTTLPVHVQDERLTSDAARRKMAETGPVRGRRDDAIAAAIILEEYLGGRS